MASFCGFRSPPDARLLRLREPFLPPPASSRAPSRSAPSSLMNANAIRNTYTNSTTEYADAGPKRTFDASSWASIDSVSTDALPAPMRM